METERPLAIATGPVAIDRQGESPSSGNEARPMPVASRTRTSAERSSKRPSSAHLPQQRPPHANRAIHTTWSRAREEPQTGLGPTPSVTTAPRRSTPVRRRDPAQLRELFAPTAPLAGYRQRERRMTTPFLEKYREGMQAVCDFPAEHKTSSSARRDDGCSQCASIRFLLGASRASATRRSPGCSVRRSQRSPSDPRRVRWRARATARAR